VVEKPYHKIILLLMLFMVDVDGRVSGEGDALLPLYGSQYHTVFSQVGLRSMPGMSGGGKYGRYAQVWGL
jgi:hypothetical protein